MTDGSPSDCVRLAVLGFLKQQPDLVVSGINRGANMGDDITYSGTVAAAMEGLLSNIPSVAISIGGSARASTTPPPPTSPRPSAATTSTPARPPTLSPTRTLPPFPPPQSPPARGRD